MHVDTESRLALHANNPFVIQCEQARDALSDPIPLRDLIRNGGFIFAMACLVTFTILMACMGLSNAGA